MMKRLDRFEGFTFNIPDCDGNTVPIRTCWVPISELRVDRSYQRNLANSHVQKIVDEFDPYKLKAINVNQRPSNRLYIWDGQQEEEAVIRLIRLGKYGSTRVRCDLSRFQAKTDEEARRIEARKYREKNSGSKPNSKGELLKSMVAEGDLWAIGVHSALTSHALAWNESDGYVQPNGFPMEAITFFMKPKYKCGDPNACRFRRLLNIVVGAFRDPTGMIPNEAKYVPFLKALGMYLHDAHESLDAFIIDRLAAIGADTIKEDALREHDRRGGSANQPPAGLVLERLNRWLDPLRRVKAAA